MKFLKHDKNIIKKSLSMALPSMLEMFFVCLAGLIDSLMVSSLGSDAVAAVGLTNQPKFLGMCVFMAPSSASPWFILPTISYAFAAPLSKLMPTLLLILR